MRCFQATVFNEFVSGTTEVFTSGSFNDPLARGEQAYIQIRVNQVPTSGVTSPTITLNVYHSNDGSTWATKVNAVNAQSLNIGSETVLVGVDNGSIDGGGLIRYGITLGASGGTPQALIEVSVCCRGEEA